MDTPIPSSVIRQSGAAHDPVRNEAHSSGVSWAAVIGGAFVAAALALILLALGSGLGLTAVSPWSNAGASAATIGIASIAWLILMQIISSAMGGYLAGRLRTKWVGVHTDEVFFRDTAHGFLVWAVSLVITATFLASAAISMVGGAAHLGATTLAAAGAGVATGAATQAQAPNADSNGYWVDTLFRSDRPQPDANDASTKAEVARIFANGLRQDDLPAADKTHVSQVVAARTGLSQADADKRVSEAVAQAKRAEADARQAADTARKAAAHLSLWTFLALLIGAFCASYAATIGGRQRDHVHV